MKTNRIFLRLNKNLSSLLCVVLFSVLFTACQKDDIPEEPVQEPGVVLPSDIDDNLYRFGVNTNPYECFNVTETPVPAGYTPFYISCYLRHGARGNVGVNYAPTIEAFTNAHASGVLNEEGERAFRQIVSIYSMDNGTDGNLTPRGAQENREIANRMYNKYRSLFLSGNHRVQAVSSTYSRCQESMAAFVSELTMLNSQLDISTESGQQFMAYLSSAAPSDIKAIASQKSREYSAQHKPDTMYFASHLFSDITIGRDVIGESLEKLLSGTMSFAAISGAFDLDNTLINLFKVDDLRNYARRTSQYIYICQCNSVEYGDRIMALKPLGALITDFIDKADAVIENGGCVADFRFGHDSQLMSFCAKIGVEGIGERLSVEEGEGANWLGWLYTPFAANFYIVFYRNNSGNVLAKCFINERETKLLGLSDGPYYDWKDLKEYFNSVLSVTKTRGSVSSDLITEPDIIIPQE